MIASFASFFLQNRKITLVIITIIAFFGTLAYVLLPKQYNPSIVAPAFSIDVPARGYSSVDSSQFIVRELENAIKEIKGVDKIYGFAGENYGSVLVNFRVGEKEEVAKSALYDKLSSRMELRPFDVADFSIKSIDPEELPQLSLALTVENTGSLTSEKEAGILLRNLAYRLREEIKQVPNTSTIDIVGGYANDIAVEIDETALSARKIPLTQVIARIKSATLEAPIGDLETSGGRTRVTFRSDADTEGKLRDLPIVRSDADTVYLRDVATVSRGPIRITSYSRHANHESNASAVFIGVAKIKGTNAVFVVDDVLERIERFRKELPAGVSLEVVQNEGETAREATNELLFHLFVSIGIVFVILVVFLGLKNAMNAAFCIPMVLGIVFIVALIFGLDINRITLFALILSLGILVDDSIVVVENNARHLAALKYGSENRDRAILESVKEVGVSIVLSTVTRIMSFLSMLAVTGMMGDYMKPIPVFASIALLASLFVAFSINPFLAHAFSGGGHDHEESKESSILRYYGELLAKFINPKPASRRKRSALALIFWAALGFSVVAPIMLGVFKARMLPKADKAQVYLWLDAPAGTSESGTLAIARDASDFLLGTSATGTSVTGASATKSDVIPSHLRIVQDTSYSVGGRFLPDFANLFRGGNNRIQPTQASMRINIVPPHDRDISSEDFVIQVRPLLREYLLSKYPGTKIRLLEDPPGPPTMATFQMKLKGQEDLDPKDLVPFAEDAERVVASFADEESIVDLSDTLRGSYKKAEIVLDPDKMLKQGIVTDYVQAELQSRFADVPVRTIRNESRKLDRESILVGVPRAEQNDAAYLAGIPLMNGRGQPIRLDDIATIRHSFVAEDVLTENRSTTVHLYAEIGSNSVVYPVLRSYGEFEKGDFAAKYEKTASGPYGMEFVRKSDGKKFRIEWGGEWELTMDTFRDMGLAMILSLLGIYFLIVAQFKSFKVGGIVMMTFLMSFFGIFPGFSILYLTIGTYFTATAMIGAIALGGIVVGNAIILIDYMNQLIEEGRPVHEAIIEGAKKRFVPVMLTSVAAVLGSVMIIADPVWSGLAWSIIWGLSASAVLTLFFIPIFYYTNRMDALEA